MDREKIYIHAAAAFTPHAATATERAALTSDPDTDLRALIRQTFGQSLRQASHFVGLAAIGARRCLDCLGRPPAQDAAIYLGTALGELRKTEALFWQVLPPGPGIAAPFDFINATANMATFHVARMVGVSARNLTVTQGAVSFESALQLALDDLRAGAVPAALVGGVDENFFPRADYAHRWPLREGEIMGEGSAWLYLSPDPDGALAELLSVRIASTTMDLSTWVDAFALGDEPVTLVSRGGVSDSEGNRLAAAFPSARWRSYIEYCGSYPTAAAYGVASALEQPASDLCIHVSCDADGTRALIVWRGLRLQA